MIRDDRLFRKGAKDAQGNLIRGSGPEGECRVPTCKKSGMHPKGRRGLCHTHRVYARNTIREGKASEKNLIDRGLLLPAKSVNARRNPTRLKPRLKKSLKRKVKSKAKNKRVRRKRNPISANCVFPKCKSKSHAKGLCKAHYSQAKRRLRRCKSNPAKTRLLRDWKRRGLWHEGEPKTKRTNPFDLGSKARGRKR